VSKRLGLLIGNSVYRDNTLARLAAPDVDVGDLADVLLDPEVGGFDDVNVIVNVSAAIARRAISDFFSTKDREDLLLLYFSCHGVLDENGRLYFAFKDTERQLLRATSISATYITDEMNASRSQRQVLILDCCHSGAFARGSKGAAGGSVGTATAFEGNGYGRVVLTATDATQYAWEDDQVSGEPLNSLFTRYLVEGLQSGEADADKDGRITVDELYDYIYPRVLKQTPKQTPGKWSYKEQGEIVIASSPMRSSANEPTRANLEFDDELAQRLARLYTRGLSAYWVEEWDKAEEVFQAINEIQPDYQDTALKLSEVKRQKKLKELYQHALAASDAKDWNAAIEALQSIDGEVKGYKDVDARLAEARKQKSLADLYAQAQQLYQAGQWQAVVNVFANIVAIENDYPDPANLWTQAQRELEAEKRQKELEGRYNQALRAMEASQWQAAREHLLAVQAAEPGFGETGRLLARVEEQLARQHPAASPEQPDLRGEEARDEGQQASPRTRAMPFANTARSVESLLKRIRDLELTRDLLNPEKRQAAAGSEGLSLLTDRSLWLIFILAVGWFLAGTIYIWQGQSLVDQGQTDLVWLIRFFVFGVLAGLVFWFILRQVPLKINWRLGLLIIAGWTLGSLMVNFLGSNSSGLAEVVFIYLLEGLFGGLAVGWVLHQTLPSRTIGQFWRIVMGCALSLAVSGAIIVISGHGLIEHYGDTQGAAYALCLGSGIAGLLVASVVISLLVDPNRRVVRWSTVLLGVAGFFLGELAANLIAPSSYLYDDSIFLHLACIGAIGTAFIGLPSRNPRRILLLSALGLIGLPLGHWLGVKQFGQNDVLVIICWGAGIGLALGLSTRSQPGAYLLTLFGLVSTAITFGIVVLSYRSSLDPLIYALVSGAAGGVLALGWSFLGGDITAPRTAQ
jgi:uncharacterized caspase-like protein